MTEKTDGGEKLKPEKKSAEPVTLIGMVVVFIILIAIIIPELLNAQNDIAVLLGVVLIIALIFAGIRYGKRILCVFGIDLDAL